MERRDARRIGIIENSHINIFFLFVYGLQTRLRGFAVFLVNILSRMSAQSIWREFLGDKHKNDLVSPIL